MAAWLGGLKDAVEVRWTFCTPLEYILPKSGTTICLDEVATAKASASLISPTPAIMRNCAIQTSTYFRMDLTYRARLSRGVVRGALCGSWLRTVRRIVGA